MIRDIESLDCEIALSRLKLELGDFKSAVRSIGVSRISSLPSGEAVWQPCHRTLVAMVAIVEEFVGERMRNVIESKDPQGDPIRADSLRLLLNRVSDSWNNRAQYAKHWFDLDLSKSKSYVDFQLFVDVRNSIIHGGGRLTRRQMGVDEGQNKIRALKTVGIGANGDQLVIDNRCIQLCFDSAKAVIMLFDSKTKAHIS